MSEKYAPRAEVRFRSTYRKPEWSLSDVLGKPDVVPSAAEHLADLRNRQMTVFAEIIRGDRPLSAFDDFAAEWLARGGRQMTREANELLRVKESIYRKVGAR